jgi:NhaP-type Na+/H+ and K+/H+ antiporter
MFNKEFLSRLGKEMLVVFIVTAGAALLAGTGGVGAIALAALGSGARAVVGVIVRNFGEFQNTPHL